MTLAPIKDLKIIIKKTRDVAEWCDVCSEWKPGVGFYGDPDDGVNICEQCRIYGGAACAAAPEIEPEESEK